MKKVILLFWVIGNIIALSAQKIPKPPFKVSKQQMYEDYDQFVEFIEKYNPQIAIRNAVTKYDVLSQIKSYRSQIDTVKSDSSFYGIIYHAVNSLADIHAYIIGGQTSKTLIQALYENNTFCTIDTSLMYHSFSGLDKSVSLNLFSFGNYLWYYNGAYYISGIVELTNKDEKITLKNMKLIEIDDISPHEYLRRNIGLQSNAFLRWDPKQQQYYSLSLIFSRTNIKLQNIVNQDIINIDLSKNYSFRFYNKKYIPRKKDISSHNVLYFRDKNILYIRFPNMYESLQDKIIGEINTILNSNIPPKVVLDVRNNRGGSDDVWIDVIQHLIADTIRMPMCIGVKAQVDLVKHFSQKADCEWIPMSFCGNDFQVMSNEECILLPSDKNIGFTGKFYVLQDKRTLSAAHSLSSLCHYSNRFITIGEPTGLIAGRRCGPSLFQLKHSGITFAMECDIDFTNVQTPEDCFQDKPNIEIDISLQDAIKQDLFWENKNKPYLKKKDPCFQKVWNLE